MEMYVLLTVTLSLVVAIVLGDTGCPPEFPSNVVKIIFENKCFSFFLDEDKDYDNANKRCKEFGGSLALPKTLKINTFLARTLKYDLHSKNPAWIGLNERAHENTFVWEDKSILNFPKDFNRFVDDNGEPVTTTSSFVHCAGDCVSLDPSGQWNFNKCKTETLSDLKFDNDKNFICQSDTVEIKTTSTTTSTPTPTTTIKAQSTPETSIPTSKPTVSTTRKVAVCPSDLPIYTIEKHLDGKCFVFFYREHVRYNKADKKCAELGGSLAMPKTKRINNVLAEQIGKKNRAWIGLNDMDEENVFKWVDGTTLNYTQDFHSFGPHEGPLGFTDNPDHEKENCVALYGDGIWHDIHCYTRYDSYINEAIELPYYCEFN